MWYQYFQFNRNRNSTRSTQNALLWVMIYSKIGYQNIVDITKNRSSGFGVQTGSHKVLHFIARDFLPQPVVQCIHGLESKLNVKVLWFQGRVFNFGNPEFYRHHILEKWVWWWNGMCLWIWLVSISICRIGNASHVGLILNLKVGLYHPQRNFVFWESRDFIFGLEIKSDRIRTWFKPD